MVKKIKHNPDQFSFFLELPREEIKDVINDNGSLNIVDEIRELYSESLYDAKHKGITRDKIALEITRLTDRPITENMINRYAASDEAWRLPIEVLPALIKVTGNYKLLEMLAEKCGCKLLHGKEAWFAEVGALTMQQENAKKRLAEVKNKIPPEAMAELLKKIFQKSGGSDE